MRVTDRLRRAGAVAAMAVFIGGGGIAACATAAGAPAARPDPPAAPAAHPRQQVEVTLTRAGQERTVTVTLPGT